MFFYSFASASLLFISLLFSLSPGAAGGPVGPSSGAFFLDPFSTAPCLSCLAFFTGLPGPPAVLAAPPAFLGLVRVALYLSDWEP